MKALLDMDSPRNPLTIPSMGYKDRDLLFESLFQTLLKTIDPEQSIVEMDRRFVRSLSYLTVNDYVNRYYKVLRQAES
jgi:hypothetical protein